MRMPSLAELQALPTLCQSQAMNLKIDCATFRVWLSRRGLEDGEPYAHTAYLERYEPNEQWWHSYPYDAAADNTWLPVLEPVEPEYIDNLIAEAKGEAA